MVVIRGAARNQAAGTKEGEGPVQACSAGDGPWSLGRAPSVPCASLPFGRICQVARLPLLGHPRLDGFVVLERPTHPRQRTTQSPLCRLRPPSIPPVLWYGVPPKKSAEQLSESVNWGSQSENESSDLQSPLQAHLRANCVAYSTSCNAMLVISLVEL